MISKFLQNLGIQPWISNIFSQSIDQIFFTVGPKQFQKQNTKKYIYILGLYRTSRPVRKSGKFSKSGLSKNRRTFSFPDAGLLTLLKIQTKFQSFVFQKKISKTILILFFVYLFGLGTFDTKFVSRDLILWELIACTWR